LTQYENVCSVPGDGQFDPNELALITPVKEHTFVSFYRKENLTYSFFRNRLSYIHKKINKLLIGLDLKDVNWAMVYKREELIKLDLALTSTLIKSEICAKMIILGYRPIEIESEYLERDYGEPKGSSRKIVYQAIRDIIKLIISVRRFRVSVRKMNR